MAQAVITAHANTILPSAPRIRITTGTAAVVILCVAAAARWVTFGNPLIHIDEEFYLLVGDRMLHEGMLPYIDIWDRKPLGLFLLFEAIRLLGGEGVWQYQMVALAFVWATALILFAMARRVAGPGAALGSAFLYVFCLDLAGGEGGQAPVWYNLPVAGAIALVFFARSWPRTQAGDFRWPGAAAMALFGIALQVKYSAVFEGVFAGLALIGLSWRRGRAPTALALDTLLWITLALLPTALAAGYYALHGHLADWWFANATSILQRGSERAPRMWLRIRFMALVVAPLAFAIPLRRWVGATPTSPAVRDDLRLLDAWAASALLGVVLFGTWFTHYALPLFAPFAVVVAPLAARPLGRAYLLLLLVCVGVVGQHLLQRHREARGDATILAQATAAASNGGGCIFVYDGTPALFRTTHSCLLNTHIFPTHLEALYERTATGIDQVAEVRRIMALHPHRVMSMEPAYEEENPQTRAAVYRVLNADYRLLYRSKMSRAHERSYVVYALKGTVPGDPGTLIPPAR